MGENSIIDSQSTQDKITERLNLSILCCQSDESMLDQLTKALNLVFSARYRVEGDSMSPTLFHGQSVLVVRPTFSWNQLRRGDVVVLRRPGPPDDTYIKRIIGLPDEEITLAGGNFYADDVLVVTPQEVPGDHKKTWWNGPNEFFVLGDNPTLSTADSRTFGPVAAERIIGRVWLRCWPLREWGLVR